MYSFFSYVGLVIGVLLSVAFTTVAESKYLSSIQRRRGPNVVGFYGLLQAFSDGIKLLTKENMRPEGSVSFIFYICPIVVFVISLVVWGVVPFAEGVSYFDVSYSFLFVMSVSSLSVYGIALGGWGSGSRYGFMGGISSTAQMISYEVSLGFLGVIIMLLCGSLSLVDIVLSQERVWHIVSLFPVGLVFGISMLAETNRHPFDLPEAESELVSGYNVEYSSGSFVLFFLGEYSSMVFMSVLYSILFLGGWCGCFSVVLSVLFVSFKSFLVLCVFIWASAAYPRYRYDQLLVLGWLNYLMLSVGYLVLVVGFVSLW